MEYLFGALTAPQNMALPPQEEGASDDLELGVQSAMTSLCFVLALFCAVSWQSWLLTNAGYKHTSSSM